MEATDGNLSALEGTATFRERMALPAEAVFEAQLETAATS